MKDFPLPGSGRPVVAVPAPGPGPVTGRGGRAPWSDADGTIVVAYRVRHGEAAENPVETVAARSEDGERFVTLATLEKERFAAQSLEKPSLVRTDDGRWRLYVSPSIRG